MASSKRKYPSKMIQQISEVDSDLSLDEEYDANLEEFCTVTMIDSDLGSDSSEDEQESNFTPLTNGNSLISKSGNKWFKQTDKISNCEEAQSNSNISCITPGPTYIARLYIQPNSPITAFRLLFDEAMSKSITELTIIHGKEKEPNFNMTTEELDNFIGLQYARGALAAKNTPLEELWSREWGPPIFSNTMSVERFKSIMNHLRFDDFLSRRQKKSSDKFCRIREIWEAFIQNSQRCYVPSENLTIGEQLLPCQSQCPFIEYMPSKPGKFGLRCLSLTDNKTKYLCNISPCLCSEYRNIENKGKISDGDFESLMKNYFDKGYNVTLDDDLASPSLVEYFLSKNTQIIGSVKKHNSDIPSIEASFKEKPLYSSEFYTTELGCTLTIYKYKKTKNIYLLSSLHKSMQINYQDQKKIPKIIEFYNTIKQKENIFDQISYPTFKMGIRWWPVAIFLNILDLIGFNSWILYKETTGDDISQRSFLKELIKELCGNNPIPHNSAVQMTDIVDGKRWKCKTKMCRNKSSLKCNRCDQYCCGKHIAEKQTRVFCIRCQL